MQRVNLFVIFSQSYVNFLNLFKDSKATNFYLEIEIENLHN